MSEAKLEGAHAPLATWCAIALWQLCVRPASATVALGLASAALISAVQQTAHEQLRKASLGTISIMLTSGSALIGQLAQFGVTQALHTLARGEVDMGATADRITAACTLHQVETIVHHPEDLDSSHPAYKAHASPKQPAAESSPRHAPASGLDVLMVHLLSDASPKLRAVGCRGIARSAQYGNQQQLMSIKTAEKVCAVLRTEAAALLTVLSVPPYDVPSEAGASLVPSGAPPPPTMATAVGEDELDQRPLEEHDQRPAHARAAQAHYEGHAPELLRDALNAVLNLSGARCAQVAVQVHGLSSLLEIRHTSEKFGWEGALRPLGEMAGETLYNLATHPANRNPMYVAELSLKTAVWSGGPLRIDGLANAPSKPLLKPPLLSTAAPAPAAAVPEGATPSAPGSPGGGLGRKPSTASVAPAETAAPPDARQRYLDWIASMEETEKAEQQAAEGEDIEGLAELNAGEEPQQVLLARAAFALMDANDDGDLTRLEMIRAFRQDERVRELLLPLLPLSGTAKNSVTGVDLQEQINAFDELFKVMDSDGSDAVSRQEFETFFELLEKTKGPDKLRGGAASRRRLLKPKVDYSLLAPPPEEQGALPAGAAGKALRPSTSSAGLQELMRRNFLDVWRKPLEPPMGVPPGAPKRPVVPLTPISKPGTPAPGAQHGASPAGDARLKTPGGAHHDARPKTPGGAGAKAGGAPGGVSKGGSGPALPLKPSATPPPATTKRFGHILAAKGGAGTDTAPDTAPRSQSIVAPVAAPGLGLSASMPILRKPAMGSLLRLGLGAAAEGHLTAGEEEELKRLEARMKELESEIVIEKEKKEKKGKKKGKGGGSDELSDAEKEAAGSAARLDDLKRRQSFAKDADEKAAAEAARPATAAGAVGGAKTKPKRYEGPAPVRQKAELAASAAVQAGLGAVQAGLFGIAKAAALAKQAEAEETARVGNQWRPPVVEIKITQKGVPSIKPELAATLAPWEKAYLQKGNEARPDYKVILPEAEQYTPRFSFSGNPEGRAERSGPQAKLFSWIGVAGSRIGNDNFSSYPLEGTEGKVLRLYHTSHPRNCRVPEREPVGQLPTSLGQLKCGESSTTLPAPPMPPMLTERDVPKLTQSPVLSPPQPRKSLLEDCTFPPMFGEIVSEPILFHCVPKDESGEEPSKSTKDGSLELDRSVFAPRRSHSDAHSFYNTSQVRSRAFQIDWSRCNTDRFRRLIAREDHEGLGLAGVDAEIGKIREVLAQHATAIYACHTYYCATGDAHDGYAMGLSTFFELLRDVRVVDIDSAYLNVQELTRIFASANYEAASKTLEDREIERLNPDAALLRFEFMQCLVRISISKYVRDGTIPDVSEALETFLQRDLLPNLPKGATHDPEVFRRKRLYTKPVADVLKRFEPVLRTFFEYYATIEGDPLQLDLKTPEPTMSLDEWHGFCLDAGLLDTRDSPDEGASMWMGYLSRLDERLCFVWSQTFVSDELKRRHKLTRLTYIDFCEALGRVCTRHPLPTTEILAKYGSRTAKQFFDEIAAGKHEGGVLIEKRGTEMSFDREETSDQPLAPWLEMLLSLILDRLDSNHDGKIDKKELDKRRRQRARQRAEFIIKRQVSFTVTPKLAADKELSAAEQAKLDRTMKKIASALEEELPAIDPEEL